MITALIFTNPFDLNDIQRVEVEAEGRTLKDLMYGVNTDLDLAVTLNGREIEPENFGLEIPEAGDLISIITVPGGSKEQRKDVMRIAAVIAIAYFTGGLYAAGYLWTAAAVSVGGNLLINALLPPSVPNMEAEGNHGNSPSYGLDGPKNTSREGIPVPLTFGENRVAGNILAFYTENVGESQYINMLVNLGEGEQAGFHTVKLNDVDAEVYGAQLTYRNGTADQAIVPNFESAREIRSFGRTFSEQGEELTFATFNEVSRIRLGVVVPQLFKTVDGKMEHDRVEMRIHIRRVGEEHWRIFQTGVPRQLDGNLSPSGMFLDPIEQEEGGKKFFAVPDLTQYHKFKTVYIGGRGRNDYVDSDQRDEFDQGSTPTSSGRNALVGTHKTTGLEVQLGEWRSGSGGQYRSEMAFYDTLKGTHVMGGKRVTPRRFNLVSAQLPPGKYEVSIKRLHPVHRPDGDTGTSVDPSAWTLTEIDEVMPFGLNYRHTALLGLRVQATDQFQNIPTVTVVSKGLLLRVYDETTETWKLAPSNNPAWICYNAYTNKRWGAGYEDSRMDLAAYVSWAKDCESNGWHFNGTFDSTGNLHDQTKNVFKVGHARLVMFGDLFSVSVIKDKRATMMFNTSNIITGSFEISWSSDQDRANEVDVIFYDKDNDYRRSEFKVYDQAAFERGEKALSTTLNLMGVTEYGQAYAEGIYALNMNKVAQSVTFKSTLEGKDVQVGDIVMVQHSMPRWSEGGKLAVTGHTKRKLILDREIELGAGEFEVLVQYPSLRMANTTVQRVSGDRLYVNNDIQQATQFVIGGQQYIIIGQMSDRSFKTDRPVTAANGAAVEVYANDVVQSRRITEKSGKFAEVSVLTGQADLPEVPGQFSWAVGKRDLVTKPFMVTNVETSDPYEYEISAIEFIADLLGSEIVGPLPEYANTPNKKPESVTELFCYIDRQDQGSLQQNSLVASWGYPESNLYQKADVYVSVDDGEMVLMQSGARNEFQMPVRFGQRIRVVVAARNGYATQSVAEAAFDTITVTASDAPHTPAQVLAIIVQDQIHLQWTPARNSGGEAIVAEYSVFRAQGQSPTWPEEYTRIGQETALNLVDSNVTTSTIYHYAVTATSIRGEKSITPAFTQITTPVRFNLKAREGIEIQYFFGPTETKIEAAGNPDTKPGWWTVDAHSSRTMQATRYYRDDEKGPWTVTYIIKQPVATETMLDQLREDFGNVDFENLNELISQAEGAAAVAIDAANSARDEAIRHTDSVRVQIESGFNTALGAYQQTINSFNEELTAQGSALASLTEYANGQFSKFNALGVYNAESGSFSKIKGLEEVSADHTLRLNSFGTYGEGGYSVIRELQQTSENTAQRLESLGAYSENGFSEIVTLKQATADSATKLNSLGSYTVEGGFSEFNALKTTQSNLVSSLTALTLRADGFDSSITNLDEVTESHARAITVLERSTGDSLTASLVEHWSAQVEGEEVPPINVPWLEALPYGTKFLGTAADRRVYSRKVMPVNAQRQYRVRISGTVTVNSTLTNDVLVTAGFVCLNERFERIGANVILRTQSALNQRLMAANGRFTLEAFFDGESESTTASLNSFETGTVFVRPFIRIRDLTGGEVIVNELSIIDNEAYKTVLAQVQQIGEDYATIAQSLSNTADLINASSQAAQGAAEAAAESESEAKRVAEVAISTANTAVSVSNNAASAVTSLTNRINDDIQPGVSKAVADATNALSVAGGVASRTSTLESKTTQIEQDLVNDREKVTGALGRVDSLEQTSDSIAKRVQQTFFARGEMLTVGHQSQFTADLQGDEAAVTPLEASHGWTRQTVAGLVSQVHTTTSSRYLYSVKPYRVEQDRTYRVSAYVSLTDASPANSQVNVAVGVVCLDAEGQYVNGNVRRRSLANRLTAVVTKAGGRTRLEVEMTGFSTSTSVSRADFIAGTQFVRLYSQTTGNNIAGMEVLFEDLTIVDVTEATRAETQAKSYVDSKTNELLSSYTIRVGQNGRIAGIGLVSGDGNTDPAIVFDAVDIDFNAANVTFAADKVDFKDGNNTMNFGVKAGGFVAPRGEVGAFGFDNMEGENAVIKTATIHKLLLADAAEGLIGREHLHKSIRDRLVLVDESASPNGGSVSKSAANTKKQFIKTVALTGGNQQTTITAILNYRLQYSAASVPSIVGANAPWIMFRLLRGTTTISIPTSVINAINANSNGVLLVELASGAYSFAGSYVRAGSRSPYTHTHNLAMQLSFPIGFYDNTSDYTLEIIDSWDERNIQQYMPLNKTLTTNAQITVSEPLSSPGGFVVNTSWSAIKDVPASATRGEISQANLESASSSTLGFISGRRLAAALEKVEHVTSVAGRKGAVTLSQSDISGVVPNAAISGSYTGMANLTGSGSVDFARFLGNAGDTVSAPSYSWTGDTDTGMWRPGSNIVAISTGGVERARFSSAGISGVGSGITNLTPSNISPGGMINDNTINLGTDSTLFGRSTGNALGRTGIRVAEIRSPSNTQSGAIVFKQTATNGAIMHQFHIQGMIYAGGWILDTIVQVYRTGTNHTANNRVIHRGNLTPEIYAGLDESGRFCLMIGEVSSTWSYPHVTLHAMVSHSGASDGAITNWTGSFETNVDGWTGGPTRLTAVNGVPSAESLTNARTFTIGNTSRAFDGTGNVNWTLANIGAAPESHSHTWNDIGNASVNSWSSLRVENSHGYIDFGPANTSFAHIYTDRPSFYFNKNLIVNGVDVVMAGGAQTINGNKVFTAPLGIAENRWSSASLSGNAIFADTNNGNGFAFGNGTSLSSWFSKDSSGVNRMIDVWNNGSKVHVRANLEVDGVTTGQGFSCGSSSPDSFANSYEVFSSGATRYGMMLWRGGDDNQWSTMIYGPNQNARYISFGKINSSNPTNHSHVTRVAYVSLDDGKMHASGFVGHGLEMIGSSGSWIAGFRGNSALTITRTGTSNQYTGWVSQKTPAGGWSIGTLNNDIYFRWATSANISAGTNTTLQMIRITPEGVVLNRNNDAFITTGDLTPSMFLSDKFIADNNLNIADYNGIRAGIISAGILGANILTTSSLNVVSAPGDSTRRRFSVYPGISESGLDAGKLLYLREVNAAGDSTKDLFYIDTGGEGYFSGSLAKGNVDSKAISEAAKKGIYPYYTGAPDGATWTGNQLRASGTATTAVLQIAASAAQLPLQPSEKVFISFEVKDHVFQGATPSTATWATSTYRLTLQRSTNAGSSWSAVPGQTYEFSINPSNNAPEWVYNYEGRLELIGEHSRSFSYRRFVEFVDEGNRTTDLYNVRYRILVTRLVNGAGTNGGIRFREINVEKEAFVKNVIEETGIGSGVATGQIMFIDKETGYATVSGQVRNSGRGAVTVTFPKAFKTVQSCTLGFRRSSSAEDTTARWTERYQDLTRTSVKILFIESNTYSLSTVSYHVVGTMDI